MFCNEEQGPQKMEELFLHLLKDRDQNIKGGSLSGILKYSFFIFGYTNNHDYNHCTVMIVSSVMFHIERMVYIYSTLASAT